MTNPTFTALSVVLGGDTDHAINATLSSSTFTLKVPYAKKDLLKGAAISLTASAADTYFFTSQETGATSTIKIAATATAVTGTFDISNGMEIAASAAGTLTADNHSDYDVEVVLVDKVEAVNNFAVGLGNVVAYDITKFQYSNNASTGGIPLSLNGPVFGVLSVSMARDDGTTGGPYLWYFDKAKKKLRLFTAVGTELNGVSVGGTVLLLKQ